MSKFTNIVAATLTTAVSLAAVAALITANVLTSSIVRADEAVPSKVVSFGDLNLHSEQGAATLYQRVQVAARGVCPSDASGRQLEQRAARQSCIDDAVARAVRQINNDSLNAYYSARTGHVVASLADNTSR